jgi:hypothetical protein
MINPAMKRKCLAKAISEITRKPLTTVDGNLIPDLQGADLMPCGVRGRNGGVDLTATHCINLLLAAVLDREYGEPIGGFVRKWRSLPLVVALRNRDMSLDENAREAFEFAAECGVKVGIELGPSLDEILGSTLPPAVSISVDLHSNGQAMLAVSLPNVGESAVFHFGNERATAPPIDKFVRINRAAFERLAATDTT